MSELATDVEKPSDASQRWRRTRAMASTKVGDGLSYQAAVRWVMGCGVLDEQDYNAAVNLSNWPGLSFPVTGRGDRVSPAMPAVVGAASSGSITEVWVPANLEYQTSSDSE